jgi:hypothetical protein
LAIAVTGGGKRVLIVFAARPVLRGGPGNCENRAFDSFKMYSNFQKFSSVTFG